MIDFEHYNLALRVLHTINVTLLERKLRMLPYVHHKDEDGTGEK
jgi:hypothetical protein